MQSRIMRLIGAIAGPRKAAEAPRFDFAHHRPSSLEELEPRLLLSAGPTQIISTLIGGEPSGAITDTAALKVAPPSKPKGPSEGVVGQPLAYSTTGTDPLGVHDYMFDWGDGSTLKWKSKDTQSHTYAAAGTYSIRAKEKCPLDAFETDWSDAKTVTITEPIPNGAAPVIDPTSDMELDPVNEDVKTNANAGTLVSDIIASAGGDRITDADDWATEGIAVIAADNTNGTWQYWAAAWAKWKSFSKPSDAKAFLLQDTDSVRFVPKKDFNGTVTDGITFRAWDQTNWGLDGVANATVNGGKTAFSTATETAGVKVNPVNDAPVLNFRGDMRLYTVDKGAPANPGISVSKMIASAGGDRITDVDAGAFEGIAVIGVNNANGAWQYSTNGGADWLEFGTPSDSKARLLLDTDLVRFVPNPEFNGEVGAGITFRAWDRTSGTFGQEANTSNNGLATAFSTATETARVIVNPLTVTALSPYKGAGVSVTLKGVGSCDLYFAQNGVDLVKIVLRGTDQLSSLSIGVNKTSVGGSGIITIQEIIFENVDGQDSYLKSIKGKSADLGAVDPPNITPLPPDSVIIVQLHNYTYPPKVRHGLK